MHTGQLLSTVASLDVSFLESPIPRQHQVIIVNHLWGIELKSKSQCLQPYFQYYTEQCRAAFMSHGSSLIVQTHQHIIDIASRIQDGQSRSKSIMISENGINALIDLTVCLLYMLDIGEFENAYLGRRLLLWTRGPLQNFMREAFLEAMSLENNDIKFERTYNVCSMICIAGFKVTVEVFHHASFLMAHRYRKWIFPSGLTEKWYKRQNGPEELDGNILQCGKAERPIKEYRYWHHRLVILKTKFNKSRPSSIAQWWSDPRDVS
ncbi:hypothetical protein BJX99DRAFT_252175 [Aspergillus californicus]